MIKFKTYKVDGITTVGLWINDQFMDELDTHSQLSVREAKDSLRKAYA